MFGGSCLTRRSILLLAAAICVAAIVSNQLADAAKEGSKDAVDDIKRYDSCIIKSIYSFYYPESYPAKSIDELKTRCQNQAEGFKCLKERTKNSPALIRRGMLTLVSSHQKHHKKFCTNFESEQSKNFTAANKCIMDKRFDALRANDVDLILRLLEILRLNYDDSGPELKQICCSFYNYGQGFHKAIGNECSDYKSLTDELLQSIKPEDMSLICEDDDKLAKLCPKLEPLKINRDSKVEIIDGLSSGGLGLYLVATLGESRPAETVSGAPS